jgi:hypothetical protein
MVWALGPKARVRFAGSRYFSRLSAGVAARTIWCMESDGGFFGQRRSETERRRALARTYYDFELECRKRGWGDPAFVCDEERDLFRLTDLPTVTSPSPASTLTGSS